MAIQTLSGELYNKEEVEAIKEELNEKINEVIITGGGVSPTTFEETVARLDETDNTISTAIQSLQEADDAITERVTALEAGGGSGGGTDLTVVNERLTALEAEDDATIARVAALESKDLTIEDNITALQEADNTINTTIQSLQEADTNITARVAALETGGGSGGSTTDELLVLTLAVDTENLTDTTTWLLRETISFDTLYQSYLAKTNKPVVINIAMTDGTGSTQYSFRDVVTAAEETQIRITGDAMSAVIAPNIRFTIDLALIKDEATGNCIINTTDSKFLIQEDTGGGTGGGSGETVSEKIFEFTGEYSLATLEAGGVSVSVSLDAIDSVKFKEAINGNYKFQLCLRSSQTQMPLVITSYMYSIQGVNYVFLFNLDSLGMVSEEFYGSVQISVWQNEDTGDYALGTYRIDKGDDDTLNLITLDERVTALEENGSGGGNTDDLSNYTYIIDSQEKFDAFCAATNATETDGNDYRHVYIKNGNYTQTNSIKIDNTVVPVLTITGESKEGVVITYNVDSTSAVFNCTLLRQDYDEKPEVICTIQNCTFIYAHTNTALFLTQAYNNNSDTISYSYTPINFFNCVISATSTFSCLSLAQCTVDIDFKFRDSDNNTDTCTCIICEQAIDTTIVYNQIDSFNYNYILYGLYVLSDKNTICKNVTVTVENIADRANLYAISNFNTCIDSTCTLVANQTNMIRVGYLNMSNSMTNSYVRYTGFTDCTNLTNCTALHFSVGFLNCTNLTNCIALFKYMYFYKSVSLDIARTNCGFEACHNLTNCSVAASNHDVITDNTKANELLNQNKRSLLIDGTVSGSNVRTLYAGFFACENLINCHDNIENIIHICKYAALIYYSFVSCTYVQGCSTNLKYIYITNNLINEGSWSIYPYYSSNYLTQNTLAYASHSTNSSGIVKYYQKLNVLDYRQSTSTSLTIKINFTYMSGCSNVSNMYLNFEAKSSTSLGTSLFKLGDYYKVQNATNLNIKMTTSTGTVTGADQLTGVHNCVLYSPSTSTCSASQTYVADYAVADTPAGGFNKIL